MTCCLSTTNNTLFLCVKVNVKDIRLLFLCAVAGLPSVCSLSTVAHTITLSPKVIVHESARFFYGETEDGGGAKNSHGSTRRQSISRPINSGRSADQRAASVVRSRWSTSSSSSWISSRKPSPCPLAAAAVVVVLSTHPLTQRSALVLTRRYIVMRCASSSRFIRLIIRLSTQARFFTTAISGRVLDFRQLHTHPRQFPLAADDRIRFSKQIFSAAHAPR